MLTFCRVSAVRARLRSSILNCRHFHKTLHASSSSEGAAGHDYLAIEDAVEASPSERSSDSTASGGEDRLTVAELEGKLNARRAFRRNIGMEAVIPTSFGVIRLDAQNTPAIHGQFEPAFLDEILEAKSEKLEGKVQDGLAALQASPGSQAHDSFTKSLNRATGESATALDIDDVTASSPLGDSKAISPSLLKFDFASSASSAKFDDVDSPSPLKFDDVDSPSPLKFDDVGAPSSAKFDDASFPSPAKFHVSSSSPPNFDEVSSLPRLNGATLSPPPDVQYRSDQYVSGGRSDGDKLYSTPTVRHGASSQQPPGDAFEEQYFAQASGGVSNTDVKRAETRNKRTSSEPLGESLSPDSPVSELRTHTSAGSEETKLNEYGGKISGRPQDVFEEQYFFNAFEESGEREEMEAFKAGVLAKHSRSPLRDFGAVENDLGEKEHARLGLSEFQKDPDMSTKSLKTGSQPKKRIVQSDDIMSDVDKLEQNTARNNFSDQAKPRKATKDSASTNVSAPPRSGPRSALDVVREMRKEKAEQSVLTNRGKVLKGETPQLWQLSSHELLSMLKRGVLHNTEKLVVINKPFGLPIHSGSERSPHRLTELLPSLARHVGTKQLFTVHRLDRDTSGALLLAKSQEEARRIQGLFEHGEVRKIYWAIVVGTPDPAAGVIDMVLAEKSVPCPGRPRGFERMQPVAEGGDSVSPDGGKRAVTHFRTLSSASECALIQLKPVTGVKHQLRSHLGLGLGFPVLGDHKYSRWKEVVPQRVSTGVLHALKLRQPEARHLPLCLHSRTVWVPGMERSVTAPLPLAFKRTLKRLKLRPDK